MKRMQWMADRWRDSGSVYISVLVGLTALLGFASLAIDVGLAYNARTQAQAAADGAALAAAGSMIETNPLAGALAQGEASAIDVASQNGAYPNTSLVLDPSDVTFGDWDLDTRTFNSAIDLTDPEQVTAVDTVIRLDGSTNDAVPAVLSRALGRDQFEVVARATAYLGWAGSAGPGEIDLPIAIPCCVLTGSTCEEGYCASGAPMPNPCPLEVPQARGDNTVSCIQFSNTADQTGCWTQFDDTSPSVNTADLVDIVASGSPQTVSTSETIFLDNGDKVPVISEIYNRFHGLGGYDPPEGQDTDNDGIRDSWVIGLPVVECQDADHCAKGLPADVKGFVCLEIREITVNPDKVIRAGFLCPDLHPDEYARCKEGLGLSGSGGGNFGIRADIPVLVR